MHYKDGTIAGYMGLNFGVKYKDVGYYNPILEINSIRDVVELIGVEVASGWDGCCWLDIETDDKFYIHPDSYHIFEPQEGDKNIDGYVFDAKLQAWKKFTVMTPLDEGVYNMKPPYELPISERNGKAFIMPERE